MCTKISTLKVNIKHINKFFINEIIYDKKMSFLLLLNVKEEDSKQTKYNGKSTN